MKEINEFNYLARSRFPGGNFSFLRLVPKSFFFFFFKRYPRIRAADIFAGAQMFGSSLNVFYNSPESPKFSKPHGVRPLLESESRLDVTLQRLGH